MRNMWATPFCEPGSRNHQAFFLWGEFQRSACGVQVFGGRNLVEACSFPPLTPGRRLLNKHIPDKPAPGLTSEVLQTSSKTHPCSSLLGFSKSTLQGNTELARTIGIVKAGGYRGKKEINPRVIKLFGNPLSEKWTSFQSEQTPQGSRPNAPACVRIAGFKSPCGPENQVSQDFWALVSLFICIVVWFY